MNQLSKYLFIAILFLSGVVGQAQNFSPLFVPRLSISQVQKSPVPNGDFVFIDDTDGELKAINSAGEIRTLGKKQVETPSNPGTVVIPEKPDPVVNSDIMNIRANGRLKDGDVLFTLKVPQDQTYRFHKVSFGLLSGKPAFLLSTSLGDESHYCPVELKQYEYFANYHYLPFYSYIKPLIESKLFAGSADIEGRSVPAVSYLETDYIFQDGRVILEPLPVVNVKQDQSSIASAPVIPVVIPEGEVKRLTPVTSLSQIPTFDLPVGAINMTATDVPFAVQADLARRGMVNFVHVTKLLDEMGGSYHPDWNPQGKTEKQLGEALKAYNLPENVGIYRMMYSNAVDGFWSQKTTKNGKEIYNPRPNSQRELNEAVEGYAVGLRNAMGWPDSHPVILDVDFEDERFFKWAAVDAQAKAIQYTLSRNKNVRIQVYASTHNNASSDRGGNANNPDEMISGGERFRLFKEAGVSVFSGTLPYFHLPSYAWNDPSHEPSVIGPGKLYASQAEYCLKSLHPIVTKLAWTDAYFNSIPANHKPANLEWAMSIYEGGDDGKERFYDQQGNWSNSMNWPEVGPWLSESLALWGAVTGSYRDGGGLYNWVDGRRRNESNDALELGKWRAYQFNRFWNNPETKYNLQLEFSLDGGLSWQTDKRSHANILSENMDVKPYVRGAYANGELLIVAVAGQPFHLSNQSQSVIVRYEGKQFPLTLNSQTVHAFPVTL